jgi:archaellum component FlaC
MTIWPEADRRLNQLYNDVHDIYGMLRGVVVTQGKHGEWLDSLAEDVSRLGVTQLRQGSRLDQIDKKLEQHDARFDQIDDRFTHIDTQFDQINDRFTQVNGRFTQVDGQLKVTDGKLDRVIQLLEQR